VLAVVQLLVQEAQAEQQLRLLLPDVSLLHPIRTPLIMVMMMMMQQHLLQQQIAAQLPAEQPRAVQKVRLQHAAVLQSSLTAGKQLQAALLQKAARATIGQLKFQKLQRS
jgi:hypothetical protein